MARNAKDLTGQKFDKLTVIERSDIPSKSGKSKIKGWLCKCECGNQIVMSEARLLSNTSLIKSCGCSKEYNKNYLPKHVSLEDLKDWDELYQYVKYILGYDEHQALSKEMIYRLKGLRTNKYMENKNIADTANYSYRVILNTFKFCISDIQRGLHTISFRDERHRFNYILKIVESNLNDVYTRMQNSERAKERIEKYDVDIFTRTAEYQHKTGKAPERFKDYW